MDHILPPSGPLPLQKEEEKRFLRVGQTNIEQKKKQKTVKLLNKIYLKEMFAVFKREKRKEHEQIW